MNKNLLRFKGSLDSAELIGARYYSPKEYFGKKLNLFFLQDLASCHEDYELLFEQLFDKFKNRLEIFTFDYYGYGRSLGNLNSLNDMNICHQDLGLFIQFCQEKKLIRPNSSNLLSGIAIGADLALSYSVDIQPYSGFQFDKNILISPFLHNPLTQINPLVFGVNKILDLVPLKGLDISSILGMNQMRNSRQSDRQDKQMDMLNRRFELSTLRALINFYKDFYSYSYFLATPSDFFIKENRLSTNNAFLSGIDRSIVEIMDFEEGELSFNFDGHRLKIGNKLLSSIYTSLEKVFIYDESIYSNSKSI